MKKPIKSEDEITQGKAKSETTHFHCYATAHLINKNKRITLALTYVQPNDDLMMYWNVFSKELQNYLHYEKFKAWGSYP